MKKITSAEEFEKWLDKEFEKIKKNFRKLDGIK